VSAATAGRRTRVLFVSNWLSGGGAERFVSNALQHLDAARFELQLCLFRRVLGYPVPDGVPLTVLSRAPAFRPWQLPVLVAGLARLIDRERPDVVLSAYSYPSAVVGSALRLARHAPGWLARVASNPEWHESGLRRPLMRRLYRRADLVLVNSAGLERVFAAVYPFAAARIRLQPNPTDFARLDALAGARPAPGPRPLLLAVGRLRAEKRIDLLLEALARLRSPEVELVLCGDGPQRGELERQAARLGLADRVRFVGFDPNPFAWMRRADLFVLTSDHEGSPNALIEAQGLGLPALATDCPFGPAEIVEPGRTGWLVPTGDVGRLAEALAEALRDGERLRAMGAAARARVRERFAAGPACERLAGYLQQVARPA
jgi:glycosyltransferase involved in cell wall biosynthesis